MSYHLCYMCGEDCTNDNLDGAFFEGQIVHPELTPNWAGFPICEQCDIEYVEPELKRQYRNNINTAQLELFATD